jgi:AcrR family transcriptional regulator
MKISGKRGRGRPPEFDREFALDQAMWLFWNRGFDGTSMADLSQAMEMSPSSLYAAFGDKEALYKAAVGHYLSGPGSYLGRALAREGPARQVMARMLEEAALELSQPGQPAGCMVALGATHTSPQARAVQAYLLQKRRESVESLAARIPQAELPPGRSALELARYLMAVLQGMSVQARDGACEAELLDLGRLAMSVWPEQDVQPSRK